MWYEQRILEKVELTRGSPLAPNAAKPRSTSRSAPAGFQLKGSGRYVTDFKGAVPQLKTGKHAGDKMRSQTRMPETN